MAQSVTSKGVARVLGSRMEGGRPWIATEFLAGPTLDEAIASYGPMDVRPYEHLPRLSPALFTTSMCPGLCTVT